MREDSLSWERPVLDSTTGSVVGFPTHVTMTR